MLSSVKITSYNVLSSHLCEASHFVACKPEHLDQQTRLNKLKTKLEKEIASNSIICLQEVSHWWASDLHTFFSNRGYYMVTGLYGSKFNGYMGIGIAVPLSQFKINEVNITRVADTKRMPRKQFPTFFGKIWNFCQGFVLRVASSVGLYKPPVDLWDNALYRTNQMLCLRLEQLGSKAGSFVVGNYHMPCMFKLPSVMLAHCALSAQHIQRFSKGDPFVYAGDFNIKPDSTMYRLLTEGKVEATNPDYPKAPANDTWVPDVEPLRSAYKEVNGQEPDFTNYAKVREDPEFIDTLDYLFLSPTWQIRGVTPLPHRSQIQGPLPNEEEPSDHVLISAELTLPDKI